MLSESIAEKLHHSKTMEPYDGPDKIVKSRILIDLFHYTEQIINHSKILSKDWSLSKVHGNHNHYEFKYQSLDGKEGKIVERSKEDVLATFILKYGKREFSNIVV